MTLNLSETLDGMFGTKSYMRAVVALLVVLLLQILLVIIFVITFIGMLGPWWSKGFTGLDPPEFQCAVQTFVYSNPGRLEFRGTGDCPQDRIARLCDEIDKWQQGKIAEQDRPACSMHPINEQNVCFATCQWNIVAVGNPDDPGHRCLDTVSHDTVQAAAIGFLCLLVGLGCVWLAVDFIFAHLKLASNGVKREHWVWFPVMAICEVTVVILAIVAGVGGTQKVQGMLCGTSVESVVSEIAKQFLVNLGADDLTVNPDPEVFSGTGVYYAFVVMLFPLGTLILLAYAFAIVPKLGLWRTELKDDEISFLSQSAVTPTRGEASSSSSSSILKNGYSQGPKKSVRFAGSAASSSSSGSSSSSSSSSSSAVEAQGVLLEGGEEGL